MDCSLFPAAWIAHVTGRDPAAEWRGRYHDEAGAFAFIKRAGGMVRLFARAAMSVGLVPSCAGQVGAVGVVSHRLVRGRALGAISLGDGLWVSLAHEGGLQFRRTRAKSAWWTD